MADIAAVKERVQTFLTSVGPVQIDEDGRFSLPLGSTRVFVQVIPHGDEKAALVMITAPVLFHIPLTPELYRYVATHADDWFFGHIFLVENEEDGQATGTILMRHMLLGDYLDKDELLYAAFGVVGTADRIDDDLQAQFGGKRFSDT